jgi:hypothetical protein
MSGVVVERSLYALGGHDGYGGIDNIQKLRLDDLTWELMELQLPGTGYSFCCFTLSDAVYLVVKKTLYSFPDLLALKKVPEKIMSWCGPSYYSRGTLYCSSHIGPARSAEVEL